MSGAAGRIAAAWAERLTVLPGFGARTVHSLRAGCLRYLHALTHWLNQHDDEELRGVVAEQARADLQAGLTAGDVLQAYLMLHDILWDELDQWAAGEATLDVFKDIARRLAAGVELSIQAAVAEYQRAVTSQLAVHREEQERLALSLERARVHDAVTGLYTRAHCLDYLGREIRLAHRYGYSVSLLVIDVDSFDELVVGLDATAVDAVLQAIAQQLASAVREVDLVCRLGSDVFGIVLPHIPAGVAAGVGERLRGIFEGWTPGWSSVLFERRITVSVGVAGLPDDGATADELLLRAEAARTHAKLAGKNMVIRAKDLLA